MLKRCMLLILVSLLMIPVSAQEAEEYRLRQMTAAQFMTEVIPVIEQSYDEGTDYLVRRVIPVEIHQRYKPNEIFSQEFDLLARVYVSLAIAHDMHLTTDPAEWMLALVKAGFRENQLELADTDSIVLSSPGSNLTLEIEVSPRDFDSDGSNEYLLQVHDSSANMYLTAVPDDTQPEGYDIQITPLPWLNPTYHHTRPEAGSLDTRRFEDLNADGLPEWVVEHYGFGNWTSEGKLYLLSWQNGRLVDVAAQAFYYSLPLNENPDWIYTARDGVTEVTMQIEHRDGWDCEWLEIERLVPTGQTYEVAHETERPETLNCIMGDIEALMQAADYTAAIDAYEQALELPATEAVKQYAQARLALAYVLIGQPDKAEAILENAPKSGHMGELLRRMQAAYGFPESSEYAVCRTAYFFFAELNEGVAGFPPYYPYEIGFGAKRHPRDDYPLPSPARVGCDWPALEQAYLRITPSPTPPPPTAPPSSPYDHYSHCIGCIAWDLNRGDYRHTLGEIEAILNDPLTANDTRWLPELHYWRAMALELLDRPNEALSEYVWLYQSAPDSAWGTLAALHLEPVEP